VARNTAVQVLDDLTGDPAAETVGFGLDGIDYDIDLSFANAEALRGFLQRYADAGRRTGGRKNRSRTVPGAEKTPPKPATPKPAAAKAAPAKTTRTRKTAEPKPTTRAAARKVPTVTFSAAE
jgi:hypothetical protein